MYFCSQDGCWCIPYNLVLRYADDLTLPVDEVIRCFEEIRVDERKRMHQKCVSSIGSYLIYCILCPNNVSGSIFLISPYTFGKSITVGICCPLSVSQGSEKRKKYNCKCKLLRLFRLHTFTDRTLRICKISPFITFCRFLSLRRICARVQRARPLQSTTFSHTSVFQCTSMTSER